MRLTLSGAEAASERISDKAEADALKTTCEASKAVCTSLVKEKKTAAPPKLFDLTSLQREANRLFGYTAKQTLDLAQALYEKKTSYLSENRQRISDRRHGRHSGGHYHAALREVFFYGGRRLYAGACKGAEQ